MVQVDRQHRQVEGHCLPEGITVDKGHALSEGPNELPVLNLGSDGRLAILLIRVAALLIDPSRKIPPSSNSMAARSRKRFLRWPIAWTRGKACRGVWPFLSCSRVVWPFGRGASNLGYTWFSPGVPPSSGAAVVAHVVACSLIALGHWKLYYTSKAPLCPPQFSPFFSYRRPISDRRKILLPCDGRAALCRI